MSQSTLSIANGTGAAVRAALNTALQAQASNQSGSSAPSTTYAYQFWADTTTGILKIRNSSNNAWIELLQLDGTITIEDGSAAAPGLALRTDLDCGLYKVGTNAIGISTAGVSRLTISATGVVTIPGDLTVSGTTTTIDTTNLDVEDKNITLGKVSSPSDTTADGGGLTLKGATDKTFNWVDSTDAWTSSEHIHLGDSKKLLLGASSDLEIYHSTNHSSYISHGNSGGDLIISSEREIAIKHGGEQMIRCTNDGKVGLYFDGTEKFETLTNGVKSHGRVQVLDGNSFVAGDGDDLKILHSGSASFIDFKNGTLWIRPEDGSGSYEKGILVNQNGSVDLHFNGNKTFETNDNGVKVIGTEGNDGQLQIYADEGDDNADKWLIAARAAASTLRIMNLADGGWETNIECNGAGAVKLDYDNSTHFETTTNGAKVTGKLEVTGAIGMAASQYMYGSSGIDFYGDGGDAASKLVQLVDGGFRIKDNNYIGLGSDNDLQIRHTGSNALINNSTGDLYIQSNGNLKLEAQDAGDDYIHCIKDAQVELHWDGTKTLETSSDGILISNNTTATPGLLKLQSSGGLSDQTFLSCYYNTSTLAGGLKRSGTDANVAFFSGSDRRIKKDFAPMPAALSKLNQISLKTYGYKDDDTAFGKGPIAQDLVSIFPEKVTKTDDGTGDTLPIGVQPWTITTDFTWEIIKAVQELSAENESLKARLTALEAG